MLRKMVIQRIDQG